MESSLNPDSWMSTTHSKNTNGTTNRTIGDIRKSINDQFNGNIRTFMMNKYPGRQMKLKPTRRRVISISNRWTKPTEEPAAMPLPQMKPRKTRSSLGGSASICLFGTASMACYTTDDKQHRDEDTMVCFYEKNNPCSTKGQGNTIGANRHQ